MIVYADMMKIKLELRSNT